MSGTFTDPGGADATPHTMSWEWGDGTTTTAAVTTEPTSTTPGTVSGTHTYTTAGTYGITCTVLNSVGGISTQTASVTVTAPTQPPTANAGTAQTVTVGTTVTLDGTHSSDPNGNTPLTYAWSIQSAPAGSTAQLSSTTAAQPTFTPDKPGEYVISLTVTNSLGVKSTPATVTITATLPQKQPTPPPKQPTPPPKQPEQPQPKKPKGKC